MDFALKVLVSFLVGGAYVSGIIWASEKLGSRVGGSLAGLPSTILVGLIFIDVTEGSNSAQAAVAIVPLIFMASLAYGVVFIEAGKTIGNVGNSLKLSFLAMLAWLVIVVPEKMLLGSLRFAFICLIALAGLVLFRFLVSKYGSALPVRLPLPRQVYFIRFAMGGAVIAASVIAARLLGPVWGGVISSFPGLLGTVLYFLNKSQGGKFLEGFVRRLPLSYFSSFIFLVVVHQTILKLSDGLSFVLGLICALAYTVILVLYKQTVKQN